MILVTGANGKLGSAVIDFMRTKNNQANITALVRSTDKGAALQNKGIALRLGDYFDRASLKNAFTGVNTLVFISSGTIAERVDQHKNVIDMAQETGIQHIIYTSFVRVSDQTQGMLHDHFVTETAIFNSGIPFTIFRNTFYDDLLPMLLGNALKSGHLYYPSNHARINLASRRDMAEAIANVALNPQVHTNQVYEITSASAYTFQEIAQMLGEAAGKQITYQEITYDALKEKLKQTGLPENVATVIANISKMISNGYLDYTDHALEKLLQRKPVDLKETIKVYVDSQQAGI